jgi:hypothetical protein
MALRFFIKLFAPVADIFHYVREFFCALRKSGRVVPRGRSLPQRVCPVKAGSVNLSFFVDNAHKIRRAQLRIFSKCDNISDKPRGICCFERVFTTKSKQGVA